MAALNLSGSLLRGADVYNVLSKPLKNQRGKLQKARDASQKGIDEFEDRWLLGRP